MVLGGGTRSRPADQVPILDGEDIRIIGGLLGDFDLSGDRLVLALGHRMVVGRWRDGVWEVSGASEPAPDGLRDLLAMPGDRIAVLRGRQVCLVDLAEGAGPTWDGCLELPLAARGMVAGASQIAVETQDGALRVYDASGAIPRATALVLRTQLPVVGYAWQGDRLAVVEEDSRICRYEPPRPAPIDCVERPGIKGLYRQGEQLLSLVGRELLWEDRAESRGGAPRSIGLPAHTKALAVGQGVLAVQSGRELRWLDEEGWGEGLDIAGRARVLAEGDRLRCWSRDFEESGQGLAGIRCVDRVSGELRLSLMTPGLVEHAVELDGQILFSDAAVGVGRIDLRDGAIALLGRERGAARAPALAADSETIAVALGQEGVAQLPRSFGSLAAGDVLWRNRALHGASAVAIDGDAVWAGDERGRLWRLDRQDGRTLDSWDAGEQIDALVPTEHGLLLVDRVQGLLFAERSAEDGIRCCRLVLPGAVHGLSLRGTRAALALGDEGLLVTDLEPLLLGEDLGPQVATRGPALAAAWADDRVLVALRSGDLEVFDLTSDGRPESAGVRAIGGVPERFFPSAGGMMIASEMGGIAMLEDPNALRLRSPSESLAAESVEVQLLSPHELDAAISRGEALAIDVRRPEEFAEAHIPGARNVPIGELSDFLAEADLGAATVVPYCVKDFRAYQALRLLDAAGVERLGAIDGFGLSAWRAAGLPVAGTSAASQDALGDESLPPPEGRQ